MFRAIRWFAVFAGALGALQAHAQGQVNVLCSVPIPWCEAIVAQFQKDTGIKVGLSQKAAGEAMAQIAAEKANPKHDVWYAGSGDAHLQAADQGLTEEYRSPMLPQLYDWAVKQAEQAKYRTVGLFIGALGFGYNSDLLAKKKLPEPKCWADLARPEYRDELQIANPNASGTAYMTIATLVQVFGEDKAFDLLRGMHRNTNNYPRTGAGAIRAVGRGETTLGVTFLDDGVVDIAAGFPVKLVAPCEGTGYQVGSMSLIKGARNAEAARRFYDWSLSVEGQKLVADTKNFQTMSNRATPVPAGGIRMSDIKFIGYDFGKYGAAAERKRLLEKWDREVYALPRG